ncbi:MAG: hypothetical protein IJV44_00090 [Prevotella sp.]|nr:hypothetical protein [Prevotella sp.]
MKKLLVEDCLNTDYIELELESCFDEILDQIRCWVKDTTFEHRLEDGFSCRQIIRIDVERLNYQDFFQMVYTEDIINELNALLEEWDDFTIHVEDVNVGEESLAVQISKGAFYDLALDIVETIDKTIIEGGLHKVDIRKYLEKHYDDDKDAMDLLDYVSQNCKLADTRFWMWQDYDGFLEIYPTSEREKFER